MAATAGLALAGALGAVVPSSATATPSHAGGPSANFSALATARAASARFHDVRVALAAGYLVDEHCVAAPGLGVMGRHYVKPANFGSTDPTKPAALLYVSKPGGGLRLVAIEFLVADADQDLSTSGDRPTMFGHAFDGPMLGHSETMPKHYDLHVWLWAHNPQGMFTPFNPAISC